MLICPKVTQEGIPEWNVILRCMKVLAAKVKGGKGKSSYADLYKAVRYRGMTAHTIDGKRKSKKVLSAELAEALRGFVNTRKRKATYADVACKVSRAGGQVWTTALCARQGSVAG